MNLTCRSIACCLLLVSTHLNAAPPLQEQAIVRIAAKHRDTIEQGTGFLVSADGLVATAYHVVYGATRVDVFSQGEFYSDVPVVAVRPLTDLALIRIPVTPGTKYYRLADSPPTGAPGELLYVQGMPLPNKPTRNRSLTHTRCVSVRVCYAPYQRKLHRRLITIS